MLIFLTFAFSTSRSQPRVLNPAFSTHASICSPVSALAFGIHPRLSTLLRHIKQRALLSSTARNSPGFPARNLAPITQSRLSPRGATPSIRMAKLAVVARHTSSPLSFAESCHSPNRVIRRIVSFAESCHSPNRVTRHHRAYQQTKRPIDMDSSNQRRG